MFTLTGKHNTADIFATALEQTAVSQVMELLCQEFVQGSSIKIMPDAHAGMGCVIGTTMTLHGKVVPNLVGVDLGCGVKAQHLSHRPNFKELDKVIREQVPSGFDIRTTAHRLLDHQSLTKLRCVDVVNLNRADLSIGTLGGGNHFIEVNVDSDGQYWLVVHSGSRNLGKQVAEHYQAEAIKQRAAQDNGKAALVAELRAAGRASEISDAIKQLNITKIPKYLAYCDGTLFDDYLHDMAIMQDYAAINRSAIIDTIDHHLKIKGSGSFDTVHNYIELGHYIEPGYGIPTLRKGAVAAHQGQRLLIPMNMRDGSLLCRGKGNPEWNESAPHGAGRLMGRGEAKRRLTVEKYETAMKGIFTTCVGRGTLDEAPDAYKPMEEILSHLGDTVEVLDTWKPIYNFKAGE